MKIVLTAAQMHEYIQRAAYFVWVKNQLGMNATALDNWIEGKREIEALYTVAEVSFARDIVPLFRPGDVECMTGEGVMLADYAYMSNPAAAKTVLSMLTNQTMPPGGPFWPKEQLDLLSAWITGGYAV